MKLALFSYTISISHLEKLQSWFKKPLKDVKLLYITTPQNYKIIQSDWMIETEDNLREIFPLIKRLDIQHALTVEPTFDFKSYFEEFDFIFISGGNTFILSYWMQVSGCRNILRELILQDRIVYGGSSAGAVYPFQNLEVAGIADDPSKAPKVINEALGLIDFLVVPHWNHPKHGPTMQKIKEVCEKFRIRTLTISDGEGIFVESNNQLIETI